MRRKLHAYLPLLWLLAIPALNIFYVRLNHGGGQVNSLVTDIDRQIPFVPIFIIPYIFWYVFITGMLLLHFFTNKKGFAQTLVTLCTGLVACYMIYLQFQTTVPRPQIGSSGLLIQLVEWVYRHDQPFNCFPSIHVFTSYLMIKSVQEQEAFSRKIKAAVYFCAWLIICSTFFVKQHVLLDAAGAIALAEILHFAGRTLFNGKVLTLHKRSPSE
ncbi:PAP2 superfamily protein [compost metagenome]